MRAARATLLALSLALTACASASIQRGAVLRSTGMIQESQFAAALADIDGAIPEEDAAPDALNELYMLRGEALEGLGRKEEAIAQYESLLRDDPSSAAAFQARGRLVQLGRRCTP